MDLLFGDLSTAKGREKYSRKQLGGFRHDCLPRRAGDLPDSPVEIRAFAGFDAAVLSAFVAYTTDGSSPRCLSKQSAEQLSFASPTVQVLEMSCTETSWDSLTWSYSQCWSALIPAFAGNLLVKYSIGARLADGRLLFCSFAGDAVSLFPDVYGYYSRQPSIAAWLSEAIIYQIIPDRFHPGRGRDFVQTSDLEAVCGGTLNGISENLDYLESLGINCIWLTPIFASPSHHGYDTTTFDQVEPRLGIRQDFSRLACECRRRGIKLLLDFPANHVSSSHPFFVEALNNPESKYVSWFRFRKWPDLYDCYYCLPHMPILESDNQEVRDYLIEQAIFWLDCGADGYRLDHAHGLSHLFWEEFRQAIKASHPGAAMIGEVTLAPDKLRSYEGRMDGCLDFKAAELLRSYFALRAIPTGEFAVQMERHLSFSGTKQLNPSFLDNHDMNRFIWLVKGDRRKLKLAALYQFLLPGPPIIYYGTEVGLSQKAPVGRLEQARLPMCWDDEQDEELLSFYRELLAFRKKLFAPGVSQKRRILASDDGRSLLVLEIGELLIMSNNSGKSQTLANPRPGSKLEFLLKTDSRIAISEFAVCLPPYTGAVLCAQKG